MKFEYLATSIIFFLITINFGFSQSRFSKLQLESDLDTLYSVIYDVHPDMFAVMPKEKFEKEFEIIKSNLKESMTDFDFFVQAAPLINDLEDGHTSLRPPKFLQSPFETDIHLETFPFKLSINPKDTSLVVLKDLSGTAPIIPEGSHITIINNHADKELIAEIARYASGERFAFRIAWVNNYYPILVPVMFPVICQNSVFDITYEIDGVNYSKTVKAVNANDIKANFIPDEHADVDDNIPNYRLEINEEYNAAIVRFDSFDLYDYVYTFLDSTFTLINRMNIKNLIVDLRYNDGGNSEVGDEFFQYISTEPFAQYGIVKLKVGNLIKKWLPEEFGDSDVPIITYDDIELISLRENPLRFNGKTYLLTSANTFSSATDFAWAFQYFKMGTIIGEETGGLVVCFGNSIGLNLPNTNLTYGVSFQKYYGYGAGDENTHGVIPDVKVPAEQAMEKAFELIRNKN